MRTRAALKGLGISSARYAVLVQSAVLAMGAVVVGTLSLAVVL